MIDYSSALTNAQDQYAQVLSAYQDRQKNLGANLETLGQNRLGQINDYYQQQGAATDQSAISRGLANTTVRNNLQMANSRQRDLAYGEASNDIAGQRLQYGQQWSGDTLNFLGQSYGQMNQLGLQYAGLQQQGYNADRQYGLGLAQLAQNQNQFVSRQPTVTYNQSSYIPTAFSGYR